MSMRKLKHHERTLLKKVNLLEWKTDSNAKEAEVMRRYHIHRREDYLKYNKIVGQIKKMTTKLTKLDMKDPYRTKTTTALLERLYNMGLIASKSSLSKADGVTVSAFCRRRLPVVMVRLKMAQYLKEAVELIEQGHVRVGPTTVTEPAFLVTRSFEDHVTWVDNSKIKRTIMKYNDKLDDYVLLGN